MKINWPKLTKRRTYLNAHDLTLKSIQQKRHIVSRRPQIAGAPGATGNDTQTRPPRDWGRNNEVNLGAEPQNVDNQNELLGSR